MIDKTTKKKPKRMAMTFMIDDALKKKLKTKAFKQETTISGYLNNLIRKDLKCAK